MKRLLRLRVVVVLVAVLCLGVLMFAFSTEGETISQGRTESGELIYGSGSLVGGIPRAGGPYPIWFRYRHWSVFGLSVWTWDGRYYKEIERSERERERQYLASPPERALAPFDYRYPLGWFVFSPLVVVSVLAGVLPWRHRRRTEAGAETAEPVAAPDRRA